jgi:hypothetical protein
MGVWQLTANMPYDEFINWNLYFKSRPVDWRDDNRFMKILQSLGIKASPEEIFESLAKLKENEKVRKEHNEMMTSLKNSQMYRFLMAATGGDKLPILESL